MVWLTNKVYQKAADETHRKTKFGEGHLKHIAVARFAVSVRLRVCVCVCVCVCVYVCVCVCVYE